ncbi:benenodin family lasso peptide [Novosphingobium panipatense]|jgi:hypothetical protein|uniref:Benenodin family lasso peptide n=1 Tax=Novosphingobium panipatense TaxID=428991 RepID=A0ABY1QT60_9SPHN|nr:benenodin family lasso peptide [Novosphingobium panipatense]SMP79600.1 hypothetical protein SAMN06296065_11368 [Novosphingobium panipatense]
MEREYEATDDGVIELGVASHVTNGSGDFLTDNPQGRQQPGILED